MRTDFSQGTLQHPAGWSSEASQSIWLFYLNNDQIISSIIIRWKLYDGTRSNTRNMIITIIIVRLLVIIIPLCLADLIRGQVQLGSVSKCNRSHRPCARSPGEELVAVEVPSGCSLSLNVSGRCRIFSVTGRDSELVTWRWGEKQSLNQRCGWLKWAIWEALLCPRCLSDNEESNLNQ